MIDDFSDQHRIVQRIIKISSKLSILSSLLTIDDLLKWGDIIREHWKLENATVATANIHMLSSQVSSLEGRLIVTQEHVKHLTKELTATNEHIKQLSAMMKDVLLDLLNHRKFATPVNFLQRHLTLKSRKVAQVAYLNAESQMRIIMDWEY